jgi:hypothetical protein
LIAAEVKPQLYTRAVKAAQAVLVAAKSSLKIDGIWGPVTQATYLASPVIIQDAVRNVLRLNAFTIESVNIEQGDENMTRHLTTQQLERLISELLQEDRQTERAFHRSLTAAMLIDFAVIESGDARSGRFDTLARNSKTGASGLFQFLAPAWKECSQWLFEHKGVVLGAYPRAAFDARMNVLAALAYTSINATRLQKIFPSATITANVLYGAHQQGVAGFKNFVKNPQAAMKKRAFTGQSGPGRQALIQGAMDITGTVV